MNLRDFRKAAPYLGTLLLAAVIFTVVRSLLLLRFYGARLPSKGLDTIIAQLAQCIPEATICVVSRAARRARDGLGRHG
jgi:hypothetical protein